MFDKIRVKFVCMKYLHMVNHCADLVEVTPTHNLDEQKPHLICEIFYLISLLLNVLKSLGFVGA